MRPIEKLQKISEKELLEIRKEKLFSWQDKNPKYLSLEEVEEVVLKEIDPIISKTYQSKSLGNLSRYQRDDLHSSLFPRGARKCQIFEAIKTFCGEREISPKELKRTERYIYDFRATLDKNGIYLKEQTTKKYLDSFIKEQDSKTLENELEANKLIRRNYTSKLKNLLSKGEIDIDLFLNLFLKNQSDYEKNLGIKAFAEKRALSEGNGSYDEDVLAEDV